MHFQVMSWFNMRLQLTCMSVALPPLDACCSCWLQLTDDVLTSMELFPPLKAPTLAYMDGSGAKPER